MFWHSQDQDRLNEGRETLMLRFDSELTAKAVCKALDRHNVSFDWDGDVGRCIAARVAA